MTTKKCVKCHKVKSLRDGFYGETRRADGRMNLCKECRKRENRQWAMENPERKSSIKKRSYEKMKRKRAAAVPTMLWGRG